MIAIIANPNAFRFDTTELKNIALLLEYNGLKTDLFFTQKAGDGTEIANRIASKYSIIAAYGGDGIINEVVNADIGESALGILPAGTTNVLAINLKIGLNPMKAALLFKKPKFKKAYLGKINKKRFILMAGVGFDAESVKNVNYKLKKINGKLSYVLAGVASYFKFHNKTINVSVGDESYKARWVIISKIRKYAGNFTVSNAVDLDVPYFDVCIFKPILDDVTDLPLANFLLFSGLHLKKNPFAAHIITNKKIEIDKGCIQIDGDFFSDTKATIQICEKPIKVVIP